MEEDSVGGELVSIWFSARLFSNSFVSRLVLTGIYAASQPNSFTYDHRNLKTRLPVRSALFKQVTGGLVVRWVTTGEYPLLYVLFLRFGGLPVVQTDAYYSNLFPGKNLQEWYMNRTLDATSCGLGSRGLTHRNFAAETDA